MRGSPLMDSLTSGFLLPPVGVLTSISAVVVVPNTAVPHASNGVPLPFTARPYDVLGMNVNWRALVASTAYTLPSMLTVYSVLPIANHGRPG